MELLEYAKQPTTPFVARLFINGQAYSDALVRATVTYNTDVGGSGVEMEVWSEGLQELINAPVQLWMGYGTDLIPYFVGRLQTARKSDSGAYSCTAFGPFRMLVGQILRSQETFFGKTLEYVIMECFHRASVSPQNVEVRGGQKFKIPQGEQFVYDSQLSEIVTSVLEMADFVGMDRPGGNRLFMATPRPGANIPHKTTYTPDDYMSFSTNVNQEMQYYSVLAYRRDDNGNDVFRVEQTVNNRTRIPPPRNRVYIVPDFAGDELEAGDKVYEIATQLGDGEAEFTMSCAPNPALLLYDGLKVIENVNIPDSNKIRTSEWSCRISGETQITYEAGAGSMSISGHALENLPSRSIREKKILIPTVTENVLKPKENTAEWDTWDDVDITFEEVDETWEGLP